MVGLVTWILHLLVAKTERNPSVVSDFELSSLSISYTMGCPPVRGDNPRALASGLSYAQVDKHGITVLYHLHQCKPFTSRVISCLSWYGWYKLVLIRPFKLMHILCGIARRGD